MASQPVASAGRRATEASADPGRARRAAATWRPLADRLAGHGDLVVPLGLAAMAVAVRAVIWQRTAVLMNDGPVFPGLAERFAAGAWGEAFAHAFHPLYPLAVAGVHALGSSWETAAVSVSIASGGLAVLFLHDFLRHAFDRGVALVGALLLAVHPYAAPFSADVQSEGLYMALLLGAVAATWRMLASGRPAWAAGAGVLSGLAYLTRPEGLGVALVGMAVLAGLALRRRWPLGRVVACGAALGLGAALLVGPYMALVHQQTGALELTRKKSVSRIVGLDTREGAKTRAPEAAKTREREGAKTRAPGGANPAPTAQTRPLVEAVADIGESARHAFRTDHFVIAAFGLVAAGGPPGMRAAFVGGIVALYAFVLLGLHLSSGYVSMRHTLPPLLPVLGYVALGLPTVGWIVLAGPARLAGRGRPGPRTTLAVGLALLLTASTVMALRPQREERAATRAAAEWLAAREPGRVATAKARDAYYAGADHAPLPAPSGGWVARLAQDGVGHLIVDEESRKRYPGLEDGALDPRVRVVHRAEAGEHRAWVVEIVNER